MFISTDLPSEHYIEKLLEVRKKLTKIKTRLETGIAKLHEGLAHDDINRDDLDGELKLVVGLKDMITSGDEHLINQYIDSL